MRQDESLYQFKFSKFSVNCFVDVLFNIDIFGLDFPDFARLCQAKENRCLCIELKLCHVEALRGPYLIIFLVCNHSRCLENIGTTYQLVLNAALTLIHRIESEFSLHRGLFEGAFDFRL
jgi:hypothetical protein